MNLNDMQLDALREMANIGSGNAATALSTMLGLSVDLSVPVARALPLAEAVEAAGEPDATVTAVVLPVIGDVDANVLLLFRPPHDAALCELLGVEDAASEIGRSALAEIGNILGSSYLGAFSSMTGLELEPAPPVAATDMLGAVVATVLAGAALDTDTALLLDSALVVEDRDCSFGFLFVPSSTGVLEVLNRLGVGEAA